jgi:single-strand DNA-binding protein
MQKVILIGNLGKDPEVKTFDNGGKVANFSVGVTERGYKTKDGKEIPDHTEWFNCVARNGFAGVVEQYVKKGNKVYVAGKLRTREYSKQDGSKGYMTELNVEELELLTPKSDSSPNTQPAQSAPVQTQAEAQDGDGLPF